MRSVIPKRRLHKLCVAFLRGYFADGKWRTPSNLEDDIVGGVDASLLWFGRTRWGKTPFLPALAEMVEKGEIEAVKGKRGWRYRLCKS